MSNQRSAIYISVPGWLSDDLIDLSPHLATLWKSDLSTFEIAVGSDCRICADPLSTGERAILPYASHPRHFWTVYSAQWQRGDNELRQSALIERITLPSRRGFSHPVWQLVRGVYLRLLVFRWWMRQRGGR